MAGRYDEPVGRDRWRDEDRERSRYERERDEPRGFIGSRERERGHRGDFGYEGRSFGGRAHGGFGGSATSWDRGQDPGYGPSRGSGYWSERGHEEGPIGYSDIGDTLGGFGNQRVGISDDELYRGWRERHMQELDRDFDEYRREREEQFHQDFDSWRRGRSSRSPSAVTNAPSGDLGAASNAGVGTTTASMTGTAGAGSAISSATGTGGSIQADTTGSTETADTGTAGGGGRSGSRSRS